MEKAAYYVWFGVTTHGRHEWFRDINTSMVVGLDTKILLRIVGFWTYGALQYIHNCAVRRDPQHEEFNGACIVSNSGFSD